MNTFLFSLVFCHIQICNDDCWVICMLLSNVNYVTPLLKILLLYTNEQHEGVFVHLCTLHIQ